MSSPDYYNMYGSTDIYSDDPLMVTTYTGYASDSGSDDTSASMDDGTH